jgi:hypothetical protein
LKKSFKKIISLIITIFILLSTNVPIKADIGGGGTETGVLQIKTDSASPEEHQALSMTVDSVSSYSSLQAFCIGWTFTFSNSNGSVTVYVPLAQIDTDGGSRTYTLPITTGWTKEFTGIAGGKSIRDLISNKTLYDTIIKAGCSVHADARIRKYSYLPDPSPKGIYTPLNTYANSKTELDSNFSEFSTNFKTNTKADYFDLSMTLDPEPIPVPDPSVMLNLPEDGSTVLQGTTVTLKGFGTGCHHIAGYVDGAMYGNEQINPNEDISTQMKYETTVKLDEIRDYTFQIKGRNTALSTDTGSKLAVSSIHTVHVVAPELDTGNIYIKCLDAASNVVISSSSIPNVPYGLSKTVSAPTVQGYSAKGSYSSFNSSTPSGSVMQPGVLSQTVTLSTTSRVAYVYFWYDEVKGPSAIIDGLDLVQAGDIFTLSGSRSYCKQAGAKIVKYDWSVPIDGVSGETSFGSPGAYTVRLTVTDSNGLTDTAKHNMTVTPPKPVARIITSGKIKENRKITIDARNSGSPDKYPINWSKTNWKIEPDLTTGATWDFGIRLEDGTVIKIDRTTDQSFLNGQAVFYFQARDSGSYKLTLSVTNTYPESDTLNGEITVAEDKLPVADYKVQETNLREYNNPSDSEKQKYGKMPVIDASYSPDADTISKRTWCYRYNSQNDKDTDGKDIYSDDITKYRFEGDLSAQFLQSEGQRLVVENDNDTQIEIWSYDVGMYFVQLIVEEGIPDNETIKELLLPSDIRSSELKGW